MNFLLDENFPKAAGPILEGAGHQVFDFRRVGVIGSPDERIMEMAVTKQAAILSTDRDFFHTLGRQYEDHYGIVVVALRQPTRHSIIGRLEWFLENVGVGELVGRTFQLRDKTWMVYPPLEIAPCCD